MPKILSSNLRLSIATKIVLLTFIILIFSLVYLVLKYNSHQGVTSNKEESYWELYENTDFNYKLYIPRNLEKQDYGETDFYKSFIVFIETEDSLGKGLAIGVSQKSKDEEVETVKEQMEKDVDAELVNKKEFSINGLVGDKLYYEPKNKEGLEKRVIAVISSDKFTYSISSVPEEIDLLLETF